MILLDTNVVSEMMKPEPAPGVLRWMAAESAGNLYVSSITQAEIALAILLVAQGRRRAALEAAATAMFDEDFAGRLLTFDGEAAVAYARIAFERRRAGRPIATLDAQIAAIARARGAALATRNTSDFDRCGVKLVNPWR